MKIVLAIASRGRPQLLAAILEHWAVQSRPLDMAILSLTSPDDVAPLRPGLVDRILLGAPGLCKQRNRALDFLQPANPDVVIFADDDYVPSRNFVRGVERLFGEKPDVVVASGRMLADGVTTGGIAYDDAVRMVEAHDAEGDNLRCVVTDALAGYGCNMAIRVGADRALRCDERLPLYGWQEDVDYTRRYLAHGRIVRSDAFAGVHMGTQAARSPGKRLGYSQIVNPVYLMLKGTMPVRHGLWIMAKNALANSWGTLVGDKIIDRRGRLAGNFLGLFHILVGRLIPEHIVNL